jgi:hypothetical protein
MSEEKASRMLVIYRKIDGKILRVGTLLHHLDGKVTEDDINKFWPGADKAQHAMVFIEGKEFLSIDKYCVDVDVEGNFVGIVEKAEVLSRTSDSHDVEIIEDLLDRDAGVVITVLNFVDDEERLRKYKTMEEMGQNRTEIINFFKQKGIV